jgi:hypothetical protein
LVDILERIQRLLTGALVCAEVALVLPRDLLEKRVGIVVSILVVISQAFPCLRLVVSRQLLGLSRLATLSEVALLFAASAYVRVDAGRVEHGGAADLTASNFEMSRLGAEAALLAGRGRADGAMQIGWLDGRREALGQDGTVEIEEQLFLVCADLVGWGEARVTKDDGIAKILLEGREMDGRSVALEDLVGRYGEPFGVDVGADCVLRELFRDELPPLRGLAPGL